MDALESVPRVEAPAEKRRLGIQLLEKPRPRAAAAPLSMDWTGHTDWSAVRAPTPRSRVAAIGELQFCIQQYSAIERQLQDPRQGGRFERGSPTASDFSMSPPPVSRCPTAASAACSGGSSAAGSPMPKSPRGSVQIAAWDESLRKRSNQLEEKRASYSPQKEWVRVRR